MNGETLFDHANVDTRTVDEAARWVRDNRDEGVTCPCCDQLAKVYRRPINSGMAVSLITMYRTARQEWQHIPTTIGGKSREEGKLRYWSLVEEQRTVKRDDGGRAGFWRVTDLGAAFVLGRVTVPKYARIYNKVCLALEGEQVTIQDALGTKFNYMELMHGVAA